MLLESYFTLGFRKRGERDIDSLLREEVGDALGPLEDDEAITVGTPFGEANLRKVLGPHTVGISMIDTLHARYTRCRQFILFHDDKRRTDIGSLGAEALKESLDQGGFARAQISRETKECPGEDVTCERLA